MIIAKTILLDNVTSYFPLKRPRAPVTLGTVERRKRHHDLAYNPFFSSCQGNNAPLAKKDQRWLDMTNVIFALLCYIEFGYPC